ncbi:AAA family ATPase [Chloroflexota bacterium]
MDFTSKEHSINWSLIVGDNGLGKTTILRCVAMSLCGTPSLMDDVEGEWLRTGKLSGEIYLETEPSTDNEQPFSVTTHCRYPRA